MTSSASGDQLTVVYDDTTGELSGVITGNFLGAARTGAIGAVAVDVLARPDAGTVGLIGSGHQAWTQLWAMRAVRPLRAVRVHSRDQTRRDEFARRAGAQLSVPAVGVETTAAVAGAGQRRETSDQITLFCSVGLAGTEVAVAAGLLRADR
jgi:alanine dehydrogenase